MNKLTLYGMGNDGELNYFILEKPASHDALVKWLNELLEPFAEYTGFYTEPGPVGTDVHFSASLKDVRIDVFSGAHRVFLAVHLPLAKRARLLEKISELSVFHRPEQE